MKRVRAPLSPIFGPILVLVLLAPSRVPAVELSYSVYVLGVPVADAVLGLDVTPSAYAMTMRSHTKGLASLAGGFSMDKRVSGRFDAVRPVPAAYWSSGLFRGQSRLVEMSYRDGNPSIVSISPPDDREREQVPAKARPGALDPLSTIMFMLRVTASAGRCDGGARTFDGHRLEVFEMRTAGHETLPRSSRSRFEGRALRCDYTSRLAAGFRLGKPRAEDGGEDRAKEGKARHGTIWLARPADAGFPVPVRAAVETRFFGGATLYLTGVDPLTRPTRGVPATPGRPVVKDEPVAARGRSDARN